MKKQSPSVLGGAMIIAGTAIGAGMLGLPMVTSGMWFGWTLFGILLTWFCMYCSGLFILEANMHYPLGAHTDSIVKDCLPSWVRVLNGLSLVFVLYVLTYAYITVGSPFLQKIMQDAFAAELNSKLAAVLFVFILGGFVTISTKMVDRVSIILLGGMVISFVLALPNLIQGVEVATLLNIKEENPVYFPYIFTGIATLVASFGYHGNVSSLLKYYQKDASKVKCSLVYGTLLTAIIYLLWIFCAHGSISRETFQTVILKQDDSVMALLENLNSQVVLSIFSNFAIISSFLGVTLGLFDWISDYFHLKDNASGRLKAACLTYFPPMLFALLYPWGFIRAIGYAGLAATIWALMIPAFMMAATRKKYGLPEGYQVKRGMILFYVVVLFSAFVMLSELIVLFGLDKRMIG